MSGFAIALWVVGYLGLLGLIDYVGDKAARWRERRSQRS